MFSLRSTDVWTMRMKRFPLSVSILAALAVAPAAHADVLTFGSDLSGTAASSINDSQRIQAHGPDTAFWPLALATNGATEVPEDGQITSVTIKGTVFREQGAAPPANLIHFQSLDPAAADGSRKVYLTSGDFYLPIDQPNAVTTFTPDNLCVHKGGTWDFNDEGGFAYGGSLTAPLDYSHYNSGAPFGVFALVPGSTTAQYSAGDQTKNGFTLYPSTTSQDINHPYGNTFRGLELLMQVKVATGDDRSYECGGPLRDPSGKVIPRMQVTPKQDAYVTADGNFTIFGYCGDAYKDCNGGVATVTVNGQQIATAPFSSVKQKSISVPMKMATADYARLAALPGGKWTATVTMTTPDQGTVTGDIAMHANGGGAMHIVKKQRVYVRGNRRLTPAAFCGVSTGCAGSAALTVKGKVVATAKFATKSKGKISINMRVPAAIYKQLKKRPLAATLAITGALGSDTSPVLLRH
jgi:hypothetical protein